MKGLNEKWQKEKDKTIPSYNIDTVDEKMTEKMP